jgi:hypothetical protein
MTALRACVEPEVTAVDQQVAAVVALVAADGDRAR